MIKLFLVTNLFLMSSADTLLLDRCYSIFKTKNVSYSLNENSLLKNPYSQLIFEKVYQQLPLLEEAGLSKIEIKKYNLLLEQLIQKLEKGSYQQSQRLQLLNSYLTPALRNIPNIISFIKSESALKYESLDTQTILKLTLSTVSLHLQAYLTHSKTEKLDWPRLRTILESISNFSEKQPAFSLYKIYRSVREKYSLEEYINCK
ncbi:MAG: hypothetical protein OXN83_03490 [Oligoflexia bacterium]|nr:hypothetical protein [Oligoflexia bacterium]